MSRPRRPDPGRYPRRPDPGSEPTVPARRPARPAAPRPGRPPRPAATGARAPGGPEPRREARDSGWVNALLGSVIAVCLAGTAAILLLGFWKPGFFLSTKLRIADVRAGVEQVLSDATTGYGLENVAVLGCNDGRDPAVTPGATFTCTVTVGGEPRTVTVTIEDRDGKYGVSPPR